MAFCQINQDILNLKKPKVRKKKSNRNTIGNEYGEKR
jgi:hypothetical protein